MEETFALALEVGVVIHGEKVAVFVEGDLLRVAQAAGEDLEAGAVGIAAQHGTFVGREMLFPVLVGDVGSLVADRPVELPVRAGREPVHIVAGVGDVDAEAVGEGLALVGYAIAVGVPEFPNIGCDGRVNVAAPCQSARRDAGDLCVEIFRKHVRCVVNAVAVLIGDADDLFGNRGEIFHVGLAVVVLILERSAVENVFPVEPLLEKRSFLLNRGQSHIARHPAEFHELADVEVGFLAAGGFRDVDRAVHIHRDGNRVFQQGLLGDERAREAVRGGEGFGG